MAVYTKIDKQLLYSFLENYELGKLLSFLGIQEGVAFPGTIFLMAGIGLFTGVKLTNNIINE